MLTVLYKGSFITLQMFKLLKKICCIWKRIHYFLYGFLSSSPIAKSEQINQTRMSSLLSQLALTSQNKFFLKSPPKARKKAEAGRTADCPDADLVMELDVEADSNDSPISQYANIPSAGLDSAICDLVSLDSQAEVEQGIFKNNHSEASGVFCVLFRTIQIPLLHFQEGSLFFFFFFFLLLEFFGKNEFSRIQVQSLFTEQE